MPVVLTSAPGVRRSGHVYADTTGISYEYPVGRYERLIYAGDRFVYYEPGRGGRKSYVGTGVVGRISPSGTPGRLEAEITQYEPFDNPVPLRRIDGTYFEAD